MPFVLYSSWGEGSTYPINGLIQQSQFTFKSAAGWGVHIHCSSSEKCNCQDLNFSFNNELKRQSLKYRKICLKNKAKERKQTTTQSEDHQKWVPLSSHSWLFLLRTCGFPICHVDTSKLSPSDWLSDCLILTWYLRSSSFLAIWFLPVTRRGL